MKLKYLESKTKSYQPRRSGKNISRIFFWKLPKITDKPTLKINSQLIKLGQFMEEENLATLKKKK